MDGDERVEIPFTLEGTAPNVKGWGFIATLDHSSEGTIISSMEGISIPSEYRDADCKCDHCGFSRRRNTPLSKEDIGNRYSVTGRVEKHSEYVFQGGG